MFQQNETAIDVARRKDHEEIIMIIQAYSRVIIYTRKTKLKPCTKFDKNNYYNDYYKISFIGTLQSFFVIFVILYICFSRSKLH